MIGRLRHSRSRQKDKDRILAQKMLVKRVFNILEISAGQTGGHAVPLGDYMIKALDNRQLDQLWRILDGGADTGDMEKLRIIAKIHMHVLGQHPRLPEPRFSGKSGELLAWTDSYMNSTGAADIVAAYHAHVPLADLLA